MTAGIQKITDQVPSLVEDIHGALRLRHTFFLRDIDQEFKDSGGRIIFAIDSNILNMHFGEKVGKRSTDRKVAMRAFKVFAGPRNSSYSIDALKISDIITQYILTSNSTNATLLLPGHNAEAENCFNGIVREFGQHVKKGQSAKNNLTDILDEIENGKDSEQRLSIAKEYEDELFDLLYEIESPHARFRDYLSLLRLRKLNKLSLAASHPDFIALRKGKMGHPFLNFKNYYSKNVNEGNASWWKHRLGKYIKNPVLLSNDKKALECLDKLNRILSKDKTRVVLITFGDDIIKIGQKYRPFKHLKGKLSLCTFSDLYLRHPSYFLGEKEVISPSSRDVQNSTEWLEAFLVNAIGGNEDEFFSFKRYVKKFNDHPSDQKELAHFALRKNEKLHTDLFDGWREHIENVTLSHVSSSKEAKDKIIGLIGQEDYERRLILHEFADFVRNLTDDSWTEFFITAAKTGYALIGLSQEKIRLSKRNIPPLFLRGAPEGEKALALMKDVISNEAEIHEALDRLDKKQDDQSNYIRMLCYALLFGAAGWWDTALLIAKRAAQIAENRTNPLSENLKYGVVTGREAFYFLSVAHRLTVKKVADLDRCDFYIQKAIDDFKDKEELITMGNKEPQDKTYHVITGIRFYAERVAINTARILFVLKENRMTPHVFCEIAESVQENISQIEQMLDPERPCEHELIRKSVAVGLRENYFTCIFILEYMNSLKPKHLVPLKNLLREHLNDLSKIFRPEPSKKMNLSIIDIYLTLYAASFVSYADPILQEINEKFRQLQTHDEGLESFFVMPYDKFRYSTIKDLMRQRKN